MPDFVVSGARGFVGRHLVEGLRSAGHSVSDARDFHKTSERAGIFINCANIASSPFAGARLLRANYAQAVGRVDTFLHLPSFVGLHGAGAIDTAQFNCGKRPLMLSPYALGKLLQERILCAEAGKGPHIVLAYLPAVLGPGGDWSAVIDKARRNGVMLPPMSPEARPNFIDVADVLAFLVQAHGSLRPAIPGLQRVILCRPESERLSWMAFLSGKTAPDEAGELARQIPYHLSTTQKVKEVLRGVISLLLVMGWYSGLVSLFERLWAGKIPPSRLKGTPPDDGAPVWFPGIFKIIVGKQPYIPSSGGPGMPQ